MSIRKSQSTIVTQHLPEQSNQSQSSLLTYSDFELISETRGDTINCNWWSPLRNCKANVSANTPSSLYNPLKPKSTGNQDKTAERESTQTHEIPKFFSTLCVCCVSNMYKVIITVGFRYEIPAKLGYTRLKIWNCLSHWKNYFLQLQGHIRCDDPTRFAINLDSYCIGDLWTLPLYSIQSDSWPFHSSRFYFLNVNPIKRPSLSLSLFHFQLNVAIKFIVEPTTFRFTITNQRNSISYLAESTELLEEWKPADTNISSTRNAITTNRKVLSIKSVRYKLFLMVDGKSQEIMFSDINEDHLEYKKAELTTGSNLKASNCDVHINDFCSE